MQEDLERKSESLHATSRMAVGQGGGAAPPPATEDGGPPQKFLCPISLEIMRDPVIVESGISFERRSIEQWFRAGNKTCPVSRKRVSSQVMIDNVFLKSEIADWLEARGQRLGSGGSGINGGSSSRTVRGDKPPLGWRDEGQRLMSIGATVDVARGGLWQFRPGRTSRARRCIVVLSSAAKEKAPLT